MENALTFGKQETTVKFNQQVFSLYNMFKRDFNKQLKTNPDTDYMVDDQYGFLANLLNGDEPLKAIDMFNGRLNFKVDVKKIREAIKLLDSGKYKLVDQNHRSWLPLVQCTALILYKNFLPNDNYAMWEYTSAIQSRELILLNVSIDQRTRAIHYLHDQLRNYNYITPDLKYSEFVDHFKPSQHNSSRHKIIWQGEQQELLRLWYEIKQRGMIANKSISVMIKQHFLRADEKKGIVEMQVHQLTDHLGEVNDTNNFPTIERIVNEFIRLYRIR